MTNPTETILEEAQRLVHGPRSVDYGGPEREFNALSKLWSAYLGFEIKPTQIPAMMILLKITREGYKHKRDNLVDVCGYAECLAMVHEHRSA